MEEKKLNQILKNVPKYQGSYALDEVNEIKIGNEPTFAIINLGKRNTMGNHWIAIGIYLKVIEKGVQAFSSSLEAKQDFV